MSEVILCDRCESVYEKGTWAGSLRGELTVQEHTSTATSYNPDTYDLCADCVEDLGDWADRDDD